MRISIFILSTLASTTAAMCLSFTTPSTGSKAGYTNAIACVPPGNQPKQAEKASEVAPMPWFVDKNMSDNDMTSGTDYSQTVQPDQSAAPVQMPLSELK